MKEYYSTTADNFVTAPGTLQGNCVRLIPGMVIRMSVENMDGETPKPGERCLLDKMFICQRVYSLANVTMNSIHRFAFYGRKVKPWTLFFVRAAIWIALGPKRYKEPHSYEVEYVGKETET